MRTRLLTLPVTVSLLILTGCDIETLGDFSRYKEDFHYSYPLKPGGRVSLYNFNGSIEVMGWEKDSVDVSGTKHAATQDLLNAIKIDVVASSDAVRIRTSRPSEGRGGAGARYFLRVPYKTELDRIESTNGSIRVEAIEAAARLRTTNGAVRATKVNGDVDAQTTNGGIAVEALQGALEASTTNGAIRARLTEVQPGRPIRAATTNGAIELTVEKLKDNDIRAGTTNGGITLRVPATTGARVRAVTTNSSVTTDFEILMKGVISKHRLEGAIGGGGPLFDLTTTNGGIKIQKL